MERICLNQRKGVNEDGLPQLCGNVFIVRDNSTPMCPSCKSEHPLRLYEIPSSNEVWYQSIILNPCPVAGSTQFHTNYVFKKFPAH